MTALTPLGQRTLAEFKRKFGKQGEAKYHAALNSGLIDRSKHENVFIAPEKPKGKMPMMGKMPPGMTMGGDGDGASGPVPNDMPMVAAAAQQGNIAGMGGGEIPEPQPNPTKPGKRRVPTGLPNLGRSARGNYQSRPG